MESLCDVDHDVSTVLLLSSSGDEVNWLRVAHVARWFVVISAFRSSLRCEHLKVTPW